MHPERFAVSAPEHELHSPVLYEYKLVLCNDIDYIVGVVTDFNEMIPSWSSIEEVRKMGTYLEPESAVIPLA